MQEGVQPTSHKQINLLEHKTPSDDWFQKNIAKYVEVSAASDLLNDILNYAQALEGEKVAKSKAQPLSIKEKPIPLSGSTDISTLSNTLTYNSLQKNVQTIFQSFEKMLEEQIKHDPGLAKELEHPLNELKQLSQSLPALSSQQSSQFDLITEKLYGIHTPFPSKTDLSKLEGRQVFWKSTLDMLEKLMRSNHSDIKDIQAQIKDLDGRTQMLAKIGPLVQQIQTALKTTPFSSEQFLQLIGDIQKLGNVGPLLSGEQSKAHTEFFNQLGALKDSQGNTLDKSIADTVSYNALAQFLHANPTASSEQIFTHMQIFSNQSNLQESQTPFLQEIGKTISTNISSKGFPASKGELGIPFAKTEGDKILPNKEFNKTLTEKTLVSISNPATLSGKKLSETTKAEALETETKMEGYKQAESSLVNTQITMRKAAKGASVAVLGSGSLQHNFANAIINHYMKKQEAYLTELAMLLMIDNQGAEAGNYMLSQLAGWNNAGSEFNYPTSNKQAEIKSAHSRYNQAKNAQKKAEAQRHTDQQEIKKGEIDGKKMTPKEKQALENQIKSLTGIIDDLTTVMDQLTALLTLLDHEPAAGKTKARAAWEKKVKAAQNDVINGNGNAKNPGGLDGVYEMVNNFEENTSSQSETAQLKLQLTMTEIQQEWTVVSTALQLLNQSYMTVARNIAGR